LQINAYTIILLVSAAVSGWLAVFAWRRRSVTAGTELALLMLAIALWSLFQGFEGMATTHLTKMLWGSLSYLGSQTTPVFFLLFALRYTQQDRWLTARRIALLWVIPFVSIVLVFTSGVQHLVWSSVTLTHSSVGITAVYAHGPWFWVEVAYGYLLILLGMIALLRAVFKLPHFYAWQARLLILATLVPLSGHIIYVFFSSSVQGIDITPIAFTLTGILVASAAFRYRLLDLRPIATNVFYEGMGDVMVAIDSENRVVDVNPAGEQMVGEKSDRLLGRQASDVFSDFPDLVRLLDPEIADARGEVEVPRSGEKAHLDLRLWPLRDRSGHLMGRLLTLHDVTEIRRAQEELRRINAELEGYAHTVSHDLKGPLTTIGLAGQSIDRLLTLPPSGERDRDMRKLVGALASGTARAESLVTRLLELAEAGQKTVEATDVDLDEVVRRVLDEHRGEIDERHVIVYVDGLGSIHADAIHAYQLFSNIIGNAIKHNDNPTPIVRVRHLEPSDGMHTFAVCDNGGGIPTDDLERVFDPFFKSDEGGTGIGLATAERIVKVYCGYIRAYNDSGACFEFALKDYPEDHAC
jgi:PAS domain S-box-containing protein